MGKMLEQIRIGGRMVESPRGIVPTGPHDEVYQGFLERLHVRDKTDLGETVRMALAASTDDRFRRFLDFATEPMGGHNSQWSLAACAKRAEIGLIEFQAFWKSVKQNLAIERAIDHLPDLTNDLILASKNREDPCPACDRTGMIQREGKPDKVCPTCCGKGTIFTLGDKHAQEKLLERVWPVQKAPQVVINQDMRSVGMQTASIGLAKDVPFDLTVDADHEKP